MRTKLLARNAIALLAALLPLAAVGPLTAQDGPYKILNTVKVGGEGGFDYVTADPANRTLYVARSGGGGQPGRVMVYNLDTQAQMGEIPVTGGSVHGAMVDDSTGHGFATSKPITMFDAKTFKVIKTIDVQGNPDGYINDPAAHRFYVLSHSAPNVTVIDDKDGTVLGTIDLGGAPEQAQLDGKGKMFIDLEDKSAIAVVDTATMKMQGKYDLSSKGGGCAGLAMDTKNGILFAACREKNNMIILAANDGHIITDLPIGVGCDGATFNPATMEAFSSQGDGTLTIVKESSPTSFAVEQTLQTMRGGKTLTLDSKTGHILVIAAEYGPPAAPAKEGGRGARGQMVPDSFSILEIGK